MNTAPSARPVTPKRHWTVMIYMGARNDLAPFSYNNKEQMKLLGSNHNLAIVVRLHSANKQGIVNKTLLIEKNKEIVLTTTATNNDSHSAQDIIDFCSQTITQFPAQHYAIIFWDHGTGALMPTRQKQILSSILLKLHNKSLFIPSATKGICFDDISETCLSECDITTALEHICTHILRGKKFDIIGFDACLMAMLEVAHSIAPFGDYMIASQEVEPGSGWNYLHTLTPFNTGKLTPHQAVQHIITTYKKTYPHLHDATLSALDLHTIPALTTCISDIAQHLIIMMQKDTHKTILHAIQKNRDPRICQHFDEPSFIDIHSFFSNMLHTVTLLLLKTKKGDHTLLKELKTMISKLFVVLNATLVANTTGKRRNAHGLSIYLPRHSIHESYKATLFYKTTYWPDLVRMCLEE